MVYMYCVTYIQTNTFERCLLYISVELKNLLHTIIKTNMFNLRTYDVREHCGQVVVASFFNI